ncbi:4-hydroxy-tetrahydrodipicolinate synthase [Streptomyces polychromogenes]|uniref:4-hydroxy-tetrahydrodipicolinate synthase n=1 Tax=Streptomyces polychromogenes TaxID=67342 RepID=A0ABN0V093_9ACTN
MSAVKPFGENLTAMITPFEADGRLATDRAVALAERLLDGGCDGLVLCGTTGESPTMSAGEKSELVREVVQAVGHRAVIMVGVGTYDTEESVRLARQAERDGAHGLLVVTPYYSRPAQDGLVAHFTAVADASGLPVCLYDIPGRSVISIDFSTYVRLAEHPRIVAVKDARGDLQFASEVMAATGLAYYSGDDPLNLAWMSIGAVGFISVAGHVVPGRLRDLIRAYEDGDVFGARRIHEELLPLYRSVCQVGGVAWSKAALRITGFEAGNPRLPHVPADAVLTSEIAHVLKQYV